MNISVCVPMHNEAYKAADALRQLHAVLENLRYYHGHDYEIIYADGGSSDSSVEMVHNVAAMEKIDKLKLISGTSFIGRGRLTRDAVRISTGDVIITLDSKLEYTTDVIRIAIDRISDGADVVLGSRTASSHAMEAYPKRYRLLFFFYRLYMKVIGRYPYSDCTCKFKAFSKDAAKRIFSLSRANGPSIDYEIGMLAKKIKLKVVEEPVSPMYAVEMKDTDVSDLLTTLKKIPKVKKRLKALKKKKK